MSRTSTSTVTVSTVTADQVDIVDSCREHYGMSGPALMGRLSRDGYTGRTLAERAAAWHAATRADDTTDAAADQQRAADAWSAAVDAALSSVETDTDTDTDLEPTATADTLATPEPIPAPMALPARPVSAPAAPRSGRSGSGVDLTDAHRQWAERPADERYWTVADALEATRHHRETAREVSADWDDVALRPSDDGRELVMDLPDGTAATLTHYSAGQLAGLCKAPMSYLATLPTDLAADCLTAGIAARVAGRGKGLNGLVHMNGHTKLRSINSDKYARFWNAEVFAALLPLTERGWVTPPARPSTVEDLRSRPATVADVLTRRTAGGGLTVRVGDPIAPAGIYASDHDMFAFLVNEDLRIDDGTPDGLARGFFVSNSEVGAGALKFKAFYYRHVCGNHIVWGAEEVVDVSIRHVGSPDALRQRFALQVSAALERLTAPASVDAHQRMIDRARSLILSTSADPATARKEVLDALIRAVSGGRTLKPASGISVGMFAGALDKALEFAHIDNVNPYSLWGAINGLTRYSQDGDGAAFADERARVDALTPKLLTLVSDDPAALSA